jgi:hypothetical protein
MHKHTYEAYKDMIKVEINYYNLFKSLQDTEAKYALKDGTFAEANMLAEAYNSTS